MDQLEDFESRTPQSRRNKSGTARARWRAGFCADAVSPFRFAAFLALKFLERRLQPHLGGEGKGNKSGSPVPT